MCLINYFLFKFSDLQNQALMRIKYKKADKIDKMWIERTKAECLLCLGFCLRQMYLIAVSVYVVTSIVLVEHKQFNDLGLKLYN